MSLFKVKWQKNKTLSKMKKYHKTVDGLRRKTPVKKFKSSFAEVLQYDDTFREFRFKNFEKSFPEFIKKVKQKVKNLLQIDWGTIFDLVVKLENDEGEERVEIISTNYFQIMKEKDIIIHLNSLLGFFEEEFENFAILL